EKPMYINSLYIPNVPFWASTLAANMRSRCCRTSVTGTSISASTPRTPIVPFVLASQPGIAIVRCHGSLCVIVGGGASFDVSYVSGPARRTGAEKKMVAIKKRLTIRFIKVDWFILVQLSGFVSGFVSAREK